VDLHTIQRNACIPLMADPMLKAKGIAQMDFALGSHDDQVRAFPTLIGLPERSRRATS
jgi:hypothetical protein